jgi:hypothetical protein
LIFATPMFNPSRDESRRFFVQAWRKRRDNAPATPMELLISDVIAAHPEYHALFEAGDRALETDWIPENGETNPFLHVSLHVAIREQLQVDQPHGIRALHTQLTHSLGDALAADHVVMEALAEQIWQMQRNAVPFDSERYLRTIRKAARTAGVQLASGKV